MVIACSLCVDPIGSESFIIPFVHSNACSGGSTISGHASLGVGLHANSANMLGIATPINLKEGVSSECIWVDR